MKGGNIDISGEFWDKSSIAANRLMVHSSAKIKADMTYYSEDGAVDFGNVLQNEASATFSPDLKPAFGEYDENTFRNGLLGLTILRFLSVALLIGLSILVFPNFFQRVSEFVETKSLDNLGIGFLYILAVPVVIFLAFASVIGIPIGIILSTLFAFSLGLGHVFAAVISAYFIKEYNTKNWLKGMLTLIAIGLWVGLKIIGFVPIIGSVITVLVALLGYGTIIRAIRYRHLENTQTISDDTIVSH